MITIRVDAGRREPYLIGVRRDLNALGLAALLLICAAAGFPPAARGGREHRRARLPLSRDCGETVSDS